VALTLARALLDTSAYSAFMRGHEEIKNAMQRVDDVYVSATILGELQAGFLRGTHRRKNERELETFLASSRVHVVDVDRETATRYAVILNALRKAGTPIPTNDIWIAASAMQHGLSIVTTDAHYRHVEQVIVEYFGAEVT
jgi:tRNA(fMet)-specific endonuclease VapC